MSELGALTWPQLEDVGPRAVLAVPLGATEQHGPHLPLDTDTCIARAIAERAAASSEGMVVAPALPFGASGEHAGFPGTLSIGREATARVLIELCRSATETFSSVVLVSAHGGNAEPLARALGRLRAEGREVAAWSPRWDGDAHAGRTETSAMLAIAPERVRLELAAPGNTAPLGELIGELVAGGVRAVSANGVLGDPAGATAAEGRALLAAAAADLCRAAGAQPAAAPSWRSSVS